MQVVECVQGSAAWFEARVGCVTASRVADVLAKLKRKDGEAAARYNYRIQLLSESLTGQPDPHYVSTWMKEGIENEPLARTAYELKTGNDVELVGFVLHPSIDRCGASPDGLIGRDGLIEIKCPKTTTHIEYLLAGVVPDEYKAQMLWQMACTGRQWCDFVSYDPRLPEHLQLFIVRLTRDDKEIADMEQKVEQFIAEIDALAAKLPRAAGVTALAQQLNDMLITESDVSI